MIEQPKFTCSPLGKIWKKQTQRIESQSEEQVKEIDEHGKQRVESNEDIKIYFTINRDGIPCEKKKKYLINF